MTEEVSIRGVPNMHKLNWEDIPEERRRSLVEYYGEPIVIQGARFEVADRQVAGSCYANEHSLAALEKGRMYWGYYGVTIINGAILSYWLELRPRMISSKIIIGSEGGIILPGMIYTESTFEREGVTRIHQEIAENATRHVATPPKRGDFSTLHLQDGPTVTYNLTPLRPVNLGVTHTRSFSWEITLDTPRRIVTEGAIDSMENEDYLYENLYNNISAYFDDPEDPSKLKKIRLKRPVIPVGEISMPIDEILDSARDSALVFKPGEEFSAIQNPIAWNNHGDVTYILRADGKYYFCPADDCEVIN